MRGTRVGGLFEAPLGDRDSGPYPRPILGRNLEDSYRHGLSRQSQFASGPASVCWIGGKERDDGCLRRADSFCRAPKEVHPTTGSFAGGGIPFHLYQVRQMLVGLSLWAYYPCSHYRKRCQCWDPSTDETHVSKVPAVHPGLPYRGSDSGEVLGMAQTERGEGVVPKASFE